MWENMWIFFLFWALDILLKIVVLVSYLFFLSIYNDSRNELKASVISFDINVFYIHINQSLSSDLYFSFEIIV